MQIKLKELTAIRRIVQQRLDWMIENDINPGALQFTAQLVQILSKAINDRINEAESNPDSEDRRYQDWDSPTGRDLKRKLKR